MKKIGRNAKLIGIVLVLTTIASPVLAQDGNGSGPEVLTNDKVITMVSAGLSESTIVGKIRSSQTRFNVSTDELIKLKQAHVPDTVINAMVEASSDSAVAKASEGAGDPSKTNPNDPSSAHEAGIYFYTEERGQKRMIELEPSISKQSKTGGFFASAMTYGIAKVKVKAALSSRNASLQIGTPRPVFYFYFEEKNSGLSASHYYATSPNEFVLVKFKQTAKGREVTVAQANAFGAQSGAMDKSSQPFKYEKIAPGVYRVTPEIDLSEGEYGFYNAAAGDPSGGAKIFDFGIKVPR